MATAGSALQDLNTRIMGPLLVGVGLLFLATKKRKKVLWVKVTPKTNSNLKILVVCGIYSKPTSRKKSVLSDHISMN